MKLLAETLRATVIPRPCPSAERPQHLSLDKGYDYAECREVVEALGYVAHIRARGEERQARRQDPSYKARRWVVERTHSWMNRCRKLLVSFEKLEGTYMALVELACAYIVFKRADLI